MYSYILFFDSYSNNFYVLGMQKKKKVHRCFSGNRVAIRTPPPRKNITKIPHLPLAEGGFQVAIFPGGGGSRCHPIVAQCRFFFFFVLSQRNVEFFYRECLKWDMISLSRIFFSYALINDASHVSIRVFETGYRSSIRKFFFVSRRTNCFFESF